MLRAIDTFYAGFRFRSRLEARWAVFFDRIGIEYDYEPQGYRLTHCFYLPDFYLKLSDCFVEVKPDVSERVNEADRTLTDFVSTTHKRIVLLIGLPRDLRAVLYVWQSEQEIVVRTPCDWSRVSGFNEAALAAQQARFEYGAMPATRADHKVARPTIYQVGGPA